MFVVFNFPFCWRQVHILQFLSPAKTLHSAEINQHASKTCEIALTCTFSLEKLFINLADAENNWTLLCFLVSISFEFWLNIQGHLGIHCTFYFLSPVISEAFWQTLWLVEDSLVGQPFPAWYFPDTLKLRFSWLTTIGNQNSNRLERQQNGESSFPWGRKSKCQDDYPLFEELKKGQ